MSYSFDFTAATKDEAIEQASKELDAIVTTQPNHAKDAPAAFANVHAVVRLLRDDGTHAIRVQGHGSLTWTTDPEQITGAQISATAWLVPKLVQSEQA